MKCVLIMPPWLPEDIFPAQTARLQSNYWQPLGLLQLAAVLLKDGHAVQFLDGSFLSIEAILRAVKEWKPRFAGIYANTFLWSRAQRMTDELKALDPAIFTCIGGPHPTAMGELCLTQAGPSLDAIVVGEGEAVLPELVRKLEGGAIAEQVAGAVVRNGSGLIGSPPARAIIHNLDTLPFPARELIKDPALYLPPPSTYRQKPVATMMTSRGCFSRCIYCFQMDAENRRARYRDVRQVLDEIELCLRQGYREIRFLDDSFTSSYDRVMEIVEGIRARNLRFSWFASSCVHQVDSLLLKAMKRAGCWSILFGAESGVQKNLNILKKGSSLHQIADAVRSAKEAGLHVTTSFMMGIPGETVEECMETISFACKLDPDMASFHCVTPFPGTELYEKAQQYGALSTSFDDYTFQGMAFVPFSMTRHEMERLRSLAFKAFYSRPKLMARKAFAVRSLEDIRSLLLGVKGLFWLWAKEDLFRMRKGHDG